MAAIAQAGGIPPLVELLRVGTIDLGDRKERKNRNWDKNAAHALAMLAGDESNKMQIARAGGIPPLVALLSTGEDSTQQYAAKALEWLARDCTENQVRRRRRSMRRRRRLRYPAREIPIRFSSDARDSHQILLKCSTDSSSNVLPSYPQ